MTKKISIRTRSEAFDVVSQALDLAQNLSFEYETRNPQFLRLRWKLSRKRLYKALQDKHQTIGYATEDAYALVEVLQQWANQFAPGNHCPRLCETTKCQSCACANTACCEA